jgi:putrescine aminotransferase
MRRRTTAEWQALDSATHLHPFTDLTHHAAHGGRIVARAEHIYIYDSDGHRIMDGMSGLWCTNLGYSQPKINAAIVKKK